MHSPKRPQGRLVEVFMCSVVKRMGYAEAFEWLGGMLTDRDDY